MGTWEGHAIPSVIYSFLALWWGFVTFVKYIHSTRNPNSKFQTSSIQPCFFCPTRKLRLLPIESFFKLTFLTIHVYMEVTTGWIKIDDRWTMNFENAHHICMLSGFIVQAFVEVVVYYGVPLPKHVEFFFGWIGFLIQALIMTVHLDGDPGLEHEVHKLWTVLIVLTFFSGTCEMYMQHSFWPVFARILFFLTQGTWLMQIAFVVWPHTSNPRFLWKNDHSSHVWLSISLMLHIVGCTVLLICEYVFVYFFMRVFERCYEKYEKDVESVRVKCEGERRLRLRGVEGEVVGNGENAKEYKFLINEDDEP